MIKNIRLKEWYHNTKNHNKNEITKILDVEYAHTKLENNDDLYVTGYGLPFIENLKPENFYTDKTWFRNNSVRLSGTSSLYKVRTKKKKGREKDIVIKWNRMGQDIPCADDAEEFFNAEYNSPFEEFSLVMELRYEMYASSNPSEKIIIQKPLAIYIPSEPAELWQTGRKKYKMDIIIKNHKEITLDINRSYAVIYEWIKGIDAVQAFDQRIIDKEYMEKLTLDAERKIKNKGFIVRDRKPHHVIIRPKGDELLRNKKEEPICALIDFELVERTREREEKIKKTHRSEYLKKQKDRFSTGIPQKFHPHLRHVKIFGVNYIYGHVESTKGRLWVVGKDPDLFDFFLPEKWEHMPKTKISLHNEMYYTVTKDTIHLVWKPSPVGLKPDMDPFKKDEQKLLGHGYNSPFEEFSLAVELYQKGIVTTYPRAIYATGTKTEIPQNIFDDSRYKSHKNHHTPDGFPILDKEHDYITIWGYWNGPDEKLAAADNDYYEGKDALRAYREGFINRTEYITLLQKSKQDLSQVGVEDLNLRGNHFLISLDSTKKMITNSFGLPEIRICNFEFLKRIK
ncbi:MAG: hypothetical protein P9M03_06645 [Candidatus Theseobacter exili]|nr:hypothetical protein [Candidatus Theseobacter exili]